MRKDFSLQSIRIYCIISNKYLLYYFVICVMRLFWLDTDIWLLSQDYSLLW